MSMRATVSYLNALLFHVARSVRPRDWSLWKWTKVLTVFIGMAVAVSISIAQSDNPDAWTDPMTGVPIGTGTPSTGSNEKLVDASSPGAAAASKEVITQIVRVVSKAFKDVASNSGLKSLGEAISYFAFISVFTWGLLKAMIEGGGINSIVSELIPLAMTFAIVQGLLNHGGVGHIVSFMDGIASSIAGSSMGSFEDALISATTKAFSVVEKIFSMPSMTSKMSLLNPVTWVPVLAMFVVQLLAKVITAFFVVLALGIYIANIALAYGSIMLAVALSFVMVPFMLIPALSWIADSWLRFTLGAAMTKIVGSFFLSFTNQLMTGMVSLAQKVDLDPNTDFTTITGSFLVLYAGLILMAVLCAYMMMQVPGIATGLLAGSAGGAGFRGMRALTAGTGTQLGKGAALSSGRSVIGTKGTDGVRTGGAVGIGKAVRAATQPDGAKKQNLKADPAKTARQAFGGTGAALYKGLTKNQPQAKDQPPPKAP